MAFWNISADDVSLQLCYNVTKGDGVFLIPSIARTTIITSMFPFRAVQEWNLLPADVIASPF